MRFAIIFLLFSALPMPAIADSINFGIASRCKPRNALFELVGVVEANDDVTFATPLTDGFERLEEGTQSLSCKINGTLVNATVRVFPGSNGECMGAGYVDITSLQIGKSLLPMPAPGKPFNWACPGMPMLVRLVIHATTSGTTIEYCTAADWTWEDGYTPITCTKENVR